MGTSTRSIYCALPDRISDLPRDLTGSEIEDCPSGLSLRIEFAGDQNAASSTVKSLVKVRTSFCRAKIISSLDIFSLLTSIQGIAAQDRFMLTAAHPKRGMAKGRTPPAPTAQECGKIPSVRNTPQLC